MSSAAPADRHILNYGAATHPGLVRSNNEDSYFASNRLLIVADGMGGHVAGELASRLVVDAFTPLATGAVPADVPHALQQATRRGNSAINDAIAADPELDGMGTTVTAMMFDGHQAALVHIGDSRAYLYRSGVLHQLTHDDTFVQWLVDDGRITEGQAHEHPQRNLVLRALTGAAIESSVSVRSVTVGDRFLLCSDGLSGVVLAENIAEALAHPDPAIAAETLVELTLAGGAPDNVTVIVADVIATGTGNETGVDTAAASGATAADDAAHMTREMPRVPLPPIPEEPAESGEVEADSAAHAAPLSPTLELARPTAPLAARRPRRWMWRSAIAALTVLLLAGGITATTWWVRSQYFVSDWAGDVAIYRGVDGAFFGWKFSTLEEDSCDGAGLCPPLNMLDLQPGAREVVAKGITAGSLAEAREVVTRLTTVLLPECPPLQGADQGSEPTEEPSPAPPTQPNAEPNIEPNAESDTAPDTDQDAATTTSSRAPAGESDEHAAGGPAPTAVTTPPGHVIPTSPRSTRSHVTITHTITARPLPSVAPVPGVNCRIVP